MSDAAPATERSLFSVRDDLDEAFARAAATGRVTNRSLSLAGETITLHIAGAAMADRTLPALSHLERPGDVGGRAFPENPTSHVSELSVRIWDTAGSGIPLPPLPERVLWPGRVAAHPIEEEGILVSLKQQERSINLLDGRTGRGYHCVADAEALEPWEVAHPLTTMLGWWAGRARRYLVHGASVGVEDGAVLIAGAPGAGKSTSALACLQAGMRFLGDDAVLVGGDPARVHSVFCSGRADIGLLQRQRHLLPEMPLQSGPDKAAAFFASERMTLELPLRAIVLPIVVPGGASSLRPASPARALLTLAPEPLIHQRHGGAAPFELLAQLTRRLPVRALEVGDDLERVPALLRTFIAELAAR